MSAGTIMMFPAIYLLWLACLRGAERVYPQKRDVSPDEVMHPMNELPANWYEEQFGYHSNPERDLPLKHILVDETEVIAHRTAKQPYC